VEGRDHDTRDGLASRLRFQVTPRRGHDLVRRSWLHPNGVAKAGAC